MCMRLDWNIPNLIFLVCSLTGAIKTTARIIFPIVNDYNTTTMFNFIDNAHVAAFFFFLLIRSAPIIQHAEYTGVAVVMARCRYLIFSPIWSADTDKNAKKEAEKKNVNWMLAWWFFFVVSVRLLGGPHYSTNS